MDREHTSVVINGELLEGYHYETVPVANSSAYDDSALDRISGMRAVWLLYRSGKYDLLKELGITTRQLNNKKLQQYVTRYPARIDEEQADVLSRNFPWLREAANELRLAYALQWYDKSPIIRSRLKRRFKMNEQVYISEVNGNDATAALLVLRHRDEIAAAGGSIATQLTYGEYPPQIMIRLPHDSKVQPEDLLRGEETIKGFELQIASVQVSVRKEDKND